MPSYHMTEGNRLESFSGLLSLLKLGVSQKLLNVLINKKRPLYGNSGRLAFY